MAVCLNRWPFTGHLFFFTAYVCELMSVPDVPYLLYADDDPDDQFLFTELLSQMPVNIEPHLFDNGLHLLQHLDTLPSSYQRPSLVILDINMPVMDGITTLKTIRRDERFADTPVVMYSTSTSPVEKQRCFELGANAFFSKPFRREDIEPLVAGLMRFL